MHKTGHRSPRHPCYKPFKAFETKAASKVTTVLEHAHVEVDKRPGRQVKPICRRATVAACATGHTAA